MKDKEASRMESGKKEEYVHQFLRQYYLHQVRGYNLSSFRAPL